MLEQGISDLLVADSGLAALINGRVYPVVTDPENQCLPFLTIQSMPSPRPEYGLRGEQTNYSVLQITAWGKSFAECRKVLAAADLVLNKLQGLLGDGTTRVLFAFGNSPIDHFDEMPRTFRSSTDYEFQFA